MKPWKLTLITEAQLIKLYTYEEICTLYNDLYNDCFNISHNIIGVDTLYHSFYRYISDVWFIYVGGKTEALLLYLLLIKKIPYEDLPTYMFLDMNEDTGKVVRWRLMIKK